MGEMIVLLKRSVVPARVFTQSLSNQLPELWNGPKWRASEGGGVGEESLCQSYRHLDGFELLEKWLNFIPPWGQQSGMATVQITGMNPFHLHGFFALFQKNTFQNCTVLLKVDGAFVS